MRAWIAAACVAMVACGGHHESIEASRPVTLPTTSEQLIAPTASTHRRMVPPEVLLRAYLTWFGGLVPADVEKQARGRGLFDQWNAYLGALGLPDYHLNVPRVTQSNTIMLAAIGRLGEALCFRMAEHDLHQHTPVASRLIFAFEEKDHPSLDEFAQRFDVLHRTFLGYPATLAPAGRVGRFYSLYQQVAAAHEGAVEPLTADQTAWATICAALVQHPDAELY